jgi:hypothetical protein
MAEPIVLSGSSLNTILRCAYQWELLYVYRRRSRPNLKAVLGIAAHRAIEISLTQKIETKVELPLSDIQDAFVDTFKVESEDALEFPEKKETKPLMQDSGVKALATWHRDVSPGVHPMMVEQNGQYTINGIPYDWTIDEVDAIDAEAWMEGTVGNDHETIVRDWKFVGRTPEGGQEYVLNMVGYAVGYRRLTGGIEAGVQLDHIVRLKEPRYVPISGPTVPDQDIRAFASILEIMKKTIDSGLFAPTGLKSGACSWCFAAADGTCRYYKKRQTR